MLCLVHMQTHVTIFMVTNVKFETTCDWSNNISPQTKMIGFTWNSSWSNRERKPTTSKQSLTWPGSKTTRCNQSLLNVTLNISEQSVNITRAEVRTIPVASRDKMITDHWSDACEAGTRVTSNLYFFLLKTVSIFFFYFFLLARVFFYWPISQYLMEY